MSRYQHKGETVAEIPPDWAVRFDATTKYGITYNTDEATNDIETWSAQGNGYSELTVTSHSEDYPGVGTRPAYLRDTDGFPHVRFYGPGNYMMRRVNIDTANPDIDAAFRLNQNATMFLVCQINDMTSGSTASHYVMGDVPNEWKFGYIDQGPETTSIINPWDYQSTNDFEDRRVIAAWRLIHHGTDDNQAWGWIGKTQLYTGTGITDTHCAGHLLFGLGATQGGGTDEGYSDCNIYESIWYPRALTDAEVDDVIDYLSARWQTTNIDSAGDTISTSTARSWSSPAPDKEGHALAGYTPVNYRVEPLPNANAPRNANNEVDRLFPSSLANLQCWFRSDHTGGMTFATGDAQSGGTVSSWTDLTGNVTANTTTSTDSAVDFAPSGAVKGGFPAITGGTSASPKSLEATASIAVDTTAGQQRLYWAVGTFGNSALSTAFGTPYGAYLCPLTSSNFAGDMVAEPPVSFCSGGTGADDYLIADGGRPADDGRIHIFVWRATSSGASDIDVESWYSGLKLPDRNTTSTGFNSGQKIAIGALDTSTFDAEGADFLELGAAHSTTTSVQTYSDADVENLIQYLCARYDVDYMPANAPITIGCWARQTSTVSQTDCCLWYDPSTAGGERWPLHPDVAQYHTTPANFDMITGAEATAVGMSLVTGQLNHTAIAADETATSNQHMEMANAYVSTETTDFPADTDGMSAFQVLYIDSATTTSYGGQCGSAVSYGRTDDVSSTDMLQHSSDKSVSHYGQIDNWLILGASYAYDDDGTGTLGYPGSTDGTPAAYLYCNDDPMQAQDDPTATSFSVQNFANWDAADGTVKVLEQVAYKHPMGITEIDELKKYFHFKYPADFVRAGVALSVETFIFSLANTVTSDTDTLTGLVGSIDNCVPFVTKRVTTVGSSTEIENFQMDAWFSSTDTLNVERAAGLGAVDIEVTVVEFDPTLVNVYSGAYTFTSDTAQSFAIGSTVTNSKAFLVFHTQYDSPSPDNNYDATNIRGRITDSVGDPGGTHVRLDKVYDFASPDPEGHWFVVECIGSDFSVSTSDIQLTGLTANDTGVSVNKGTTLLLGSFKCGSGQHAANAPHTMDATLDSDTQVTVQRKGTDGTMDWHGFLVDFADGTTVQHGGTYAQGATASEDVAITTPVSKTRSMVVLSGNMGGTTGGSFPGNAAADVPDASVQLTLIDSDTGGDFDEVRVRHNTDGGDADNDISWCVVEWAG